MSNLSSMRSILQWCDKESLPYNTMVKRRKQSGLGHRIHSKMWLLTPSEWEKVKKTPLYDSKRVLPRKPRKKKAQKSRHNTSTSRRRTS